MKRVPRQIGTGVGRCEGPVIRPDGEIVVVSMDHGKVYKIRDGRSEVLADVGDVPNGATEGSDGTIYVTQAGGEPKHRIGHAGGVQAISRDGTFRWLTQDPIAPNDLCFGPDGLLYVTDPTRNRPARNDSRLFRCNLETGEAELLFSSDWYMNGIGFGLDDAVYVAYSMTERPGIVRYAYDGGRLGKQERFVEIPAGHRPDGFLFDVEGNIVIACNCVGNEPGQIQTYDRNGKHLDTYIPGPHRNYTNVALGSDRVLIITDTSGGAVLAVDDWPYAGLPLYPYRVQGGRS